MAIMSNPIEIWESNGPQNIYDVDPDPCTGQMNKTHVLTVCMGTNVVPTEGQPQNEKHKWSHKK